MARKKIVRRERGENWEPKVRARPDRGNWMVDLGTKFTPRKIYFPTEEEATAAAAQKKLEYLSRLSGQKQVVKEKSAFNWFNLSNVQQNHLIEAYTACAGDTAKLIRAWSFHKKHTSTADASRLLEDVEKEYITAKEASGRRARTIRDAKGKLAPFVAKLGKVSISEITTADVEGWLNDTGYSPSTRNAYRVAIVGLFNHAAKRRYIEHNPATAIEAVSVDQGMPTIHTPAQVKAMLHAATALPTHKARAKVVPYLAIGYFAGLRPENELVNLDWKDINFDDRTIRVSPATAKKRRQRYVTMSDNLVKWLARYVKASGKIGISRRYFREVRDTAKVDWSKDVMRHSFGSYLLGQNQDAPATAMQMGHSRVDVLFNHYRNLVKKAAVVEYWGIVPESKPDIIQMPIAMSNARSAAG
jgi:integrase